MDLILAVDDSPEMLELYTAILSPHYSLITATNGEEALIQALDHLPTLIISDVRMPVLDGHGMLSALKMNSETRGIPVIFVTTYDTVEARLSEYRGDVEDFILKPFVAKDFLARIEALVTKAHKRRKAAHRADELEMQLDYVRQFQYNLLPGKLPTVPGYAIAADLIFLDKVGGDFYDVKLDANGILHFIIADVSGHGVMPAFLVAILSLTFRAYHAQTADCAALLNELDRAIFEYGIQGFFATAFYARLNTKTGELQYANAAHPKMLLLRGDTDEVSLLDTEGLPLGPFFDSSGNKISKYGQASLTLAPGDRVMLYTDGISEASDTRDNMFGEEGVKHHLLSSRNLVPDAVIDSLIRSVTKFSAGVERSDDMTALLLSRDIGQ